MYNRFRTAKKMTSIRANDSTESRPIERKIEDIIRNKEKIEDTVPLIYTERSEGVMPSYDIRTDRFEIAIDGKTAIERSRKAKREEQAKAEMKVVKNNEQTGTSTEN